VPHIIQSGAEVWLVGHEEQGRLGLPEKTSSSPHAKQRWENLGPLIVPSLKMVVSRAPSSRAVAAYSLGQEVWIVTVDMKLLISSPLPLAAWLVLKTQPWSDRVLDVRTPMAPP
jgi:hypothetical protein